MSILSSIKSAGKKVAVGVYNTVNSVGKALSGGKSNAASASMAFPVLPGTKLSSEQKSIAPTMTVAPNKAIGEPGGAGYAYSGGVMSVNNPTSISIARNAANAYGGQTPVKNYSPYTAPSTISAGGKPSSGLTGSGAESVLGAFSMSNGQASRTASPVSFSGINANSLSGSNSVNTLPSGLGGSNIGAINNAGIATMVADTKQLDPATNQFVEKQVDVNKTNAQAEADKTSKSIEELISGLTQKDSVLNSEEVKQQNEIVRQRQQEVNNYTAQLNSIVAKQNQDLLNLRGIGSTEGVTETVYGGQAATINREAAIRALPIQAQIAAAQGNLELAQDYLAQVKEVKQEQIDNEYNYNMAKFKAVYDVLTAKEKRQLDKIAQNEERAYANAKTNLETQKSWAELAIKQGKSNLVAQINAVNVGDPNFTEKMGRIVSQIPGATSTGGGVLSTLPTSIQGKIISIAQGVTDSPIGKRYNAAVESVNTVNGIDAKSKNPADHQAIVYAFAKALDPDSAVKEGEYDTIKKYAQSTVDKYKKEITNAINGTGFLSEGAIKNIQTTMSNLLISRKPQFENLVKEQARIIDNIAGKPVSSEIMIDYTGGVGVDTQSSGNTSKPAPGAIIESGGKRYRIGADGETLEQI